MEAADDFRTAFGGGPMPQRPDNALDLLSDGLEDSEFDPDSPEGYKGLWRWPDGRLATPEEVATALSSDVRLVATMADEIAAEIDREIAIPLVVAAAKVRSQK